MAELHEVYDSTKGSLSLESDTAGEAVTLAAMTETTNFATKYAKSTTYPAGLVSVSISKDIDFSSATYAFHNATDLTSVEIIGEGSLGAMASSAIPAYMFDGCTKLTDCKVTREESGQTETLCTLMNHPQISKIGAFAFRNCSALKFDEIDDEGNTGLYLCNIGEMERSVIEAGESAFEGCPGFNTLKLSYYYNGEGTPTGTAIGNSAFKDCTGLTTLIIETWSEEQGDIPPTFGSHTFYGCTALSNIDEADLRKFNTVSEYMFYGCTSLESAAVSGTKDIGLYAFAQCSKFQFLHITECTIDQARTIPDSALEGTLITATTEFMSHTIFIVRDPDSGESKEAVLAAWVTKNATYGPYMGLFTEDIGAGWIYYKDADDHWAKLFQNPQASIDSLTEETENLRDEMNELNNGFAFKEDSPEGDAPYEELWKVISSRGAGQAYVVGNHSTIDMDVYKYEQIQSIYKGEGAPATDIYATVGSTYLDTTSGTLYVCTAYQEIEEPLTRTATWKALGGTEYITIKATDETGKMETFSVEELDEATVAKLIQCKYPILFNLIIQGVTDSIPAICSSYLYENVNANMVSGEVVICGGNEITSKTTHKFLFSYSTTSRKGSILKNDITVYTDTPSEATATAKGITVDGTTYKLAGEAPTTVETFTVTNALNIGAEDATVSTHLYPSYISFVDTTTPVTKNIKLDNGELAIDTNRILDASLIENSLSYEKAGKVLDAYQGKVISDALAAKAPKNYDGTGKIVGTDSNGDILTTEYDVTKLGLIREIRYNGESAGGQTEAIIYSPADAGTAGYFLKSSGTGAPTWASIASALSFKGTVADQTELATKEKGVGFVYSVSDEEYTNYACDGTQWISIGKVIDMSAYQTKIISGAAKARVLASDATDGHIAESSITTTQLGYLSDVTSNIQTQLDAKASSTEVSQHTDKFTALAGGTIPGISALIGDDTHPVYINASGQITPISQALGSASHMDVAQGLAGSGLVDSGLFQTKTANAIVVTGDTGKTLVNLEGDVGSASQLMYVNAGVPTAGMSFLSGSETPSSTTGNDGDIYFQYEA